MQTFYAVIPAAGCGSRTGFAKNKILQKLGGVTVLRRTVSAFARHPRIGKIAVCVNETDREEIQTELRDFPQVLFTEGGKTRAESVFNALSELKKSPPDYVLVHDAARPFVTQKIIDDCIRCLIEHGSAVCSLPCTDTLAAADFGMITGSLDRGKMRLLQTPQGFGYADLLSAYERVENADAYTDDSGIYAQYVAPPFLFAGDIKNVKLTYAEDFKMENFTRCGVGVDTHKFGEGSEIVLGGVYIPHEKKLIAHSDGDVLVHAIMDALLSAAGRADIGTQFPDTDKKFAGADSLKLLGSVYDMLKNDGFAVVNVSAAIVSEKPKLAPYIPKMKENIAYVLHISERDVGVSAGTNEGLGYVGKGEGITVFANAAIRSEF